MTNKLIDVEAGRDATVTVEGDVVGGDKNAEAKKPGIAKQAMDLIIRFAKWLAKFAGA